MFAGWGSRVARLRWPVLIIALFAVIGSGVWGFGVFDRLSEGGYNDPRSESGRATEVVAEALDGEGGDVIAIYTPDRGTIDDAALSKRIKERLAALPESEVSAQNSYWAATAKARASFAAEDKSSAIAVITLVGDDDAEKMDAYAQIEDDFTVAGAHVQLAGGVPLNHTSSTRSTADLASAELISLPIVLILLLLIFGSLVAAALPVLIGGCAVLGSLGVLHAVALSHEVNSFAVNVASLLGLGMAIDYGLFMVGRFREEQANHNTAEAVRRTVATAGRTVLFSATLLMTALAGLLLFPQGFLKSLAYGGLASVFLAMLLSLTLLPAILAIIGSGVDKLPVRLPLRRRPDSGRPRGWDRLAGVVLRRPFLVALPILAALLVLALPITDARFGENDERVLPAGDPSRVAVETLKADYPQFSADGVQLVVRGTDGEKPDVRKFVEAAGKVPGVAEITTSGTSDDVVVLNADLESTDTFSAEARQAVEDLRALPAPANAEVLVGGMTARNVDSLAAIADKLPLMIGLLAGATLVLMFLAFGSILLPIKAVVMSALSLCATFGILVWIFQDGHGAGLLDVTPAPLEAGIVVLMAAVVFGLSTDYEVFLLSRMVEARTRGASTAEAVTIGLSRTGRVISAAALLLILVTGAFALSSVTTMKFVGVGMIIALILDATVVRMLLVPAVLALFGDAAWWAPGPLRRLQERAGLSEHAGEAEITDWQPPITATATLASDDTVTFALPAGATQAALPAGTPASQTVVLDYAAVLDYIAEKADPSLSFPALPAGPGEKTTVLPLVPAAEDSSAPESSSSSSSDAASASSSAAASAATSTSSSAQASAATSAFPSEATSAIPSALVSTSASSSPSAEDDLVDLPVTSLLGLEPEKLTEGAATYPSLFAEDEEPSAAPADTVTPAAATPIMDAVAEDAESPDAPPTLQASAEAILPSSSDAAPADDVFRSRDLTHDAFRSRDLTDDDVPSHDLTDADVLGSDLTDADVLGSNLTDADVLGSNLADADFRGSDFADAEPAGAVFASADSEPLPPLLEAVTRAAAVEAEPPTPAEPSEESEPIFTAAASFVALEKASSGTGPTAAPTDSVSISGAYDEADETGASSEPPAEPSDAMAAKTETTDAAASIAAEPKFLFSILAPDGTEQSLPTGYQGVSMTEAGDEAKARPESDVLLTGDPTPAPERGPQPEAGQETEPRPDARQTNIVPAAGAEVAERPKHAEPAENAEHAEPAEHAEHAEPAEHAEQAELAEHIRLAQPAKQAKPDGQTEPANQAEALNQAEPVKQPEPVNQGQPVKQPEPVNQGQPVKQPEPVNQAESADQPEPVNQTEPVNLAGTSGNERPLIDTLPGPIRTESFVPIGSEAATGAPAAPADTTESLIGRDQDRTDSAGAQSEPDEARAADRQESETSTAGFNTVVLPTIMTGRQLDTARSEPMDDLDLAKPGAASEVGATPEPANEPAAATRQLTNDAHSAQPASTNETGTTALETTSATDTTTPETTSNTSTTTPEPTSNTGTTTAKHEATDETGAAESSETDADLAKYEAANDTEATPAKHAATGETDAAEPASGTGAGPSVSVGAEEEGGRPASAPAGVEDLFAWRSDPRLANVISPAPDSFGWLSRSAANGEDETTPAVESAPAARSDGSPLGEKDEAQAAPAPWQPAARMPDAALPFSFPDRSAGPRPQTLGDWTGGKPAQDRPRSLEDLPAPVSSVPAPGRRPQTLDEWLSDGASENKRPARPESLDDLAAAPRPVSAQPLPGDVATPPAGRTTDDGEGSEFIRRPQTLDEWLKGGPAAGAERPGSLGDLSTTGGIRRPKTLDDWLSGATPTGASAPPEGTARPATLADDEAGRRRTGNGGPHHWAGKSGEHPYDRSGRRPSSLADHPGSASRAGRKAADGEPESDPAPHA